MFYFFKISVLLICLSVAACATSDKQQSPVANSAPAWQENTAQGTREPAYSDSGAYQPPPVVKSKNKFGFPDYHPSLLERYEQIRPEDPYEVWPEE